MLFKKKVYVAADAEPIDIPPDQLRVNPCVVLPVIFVPVIAVGAIGGG